MHEHVVYRAGKITNFEENGLNDTTAEIRFMNFNVFGSLSKRRLHLCILFRALKNYCEISRIMVKALQFLGGQKT